MTDLSLDAVAPARSPLELRSSTLITALNWVSHAAASDKDSMWSTIKFLIGDSDFHPPIYDSEWDRKPVSGFAVTLMATNRYKAAIATVTVPSLEIPLIWNPISFTIERNALAAMMKSWTRSTRTITLRPESDHVSFAATANDSTVTTATVPYGPEEFARLIQALPDTSDWSSTSNLSQFAFDPKFLDGFLKATVKVSRSGYLAFAGNDRHRAFMLQPTGVLNPQINLVGLLMPVKLDNKEKK